MTMTRRTFSAMAALAPAALGQGRTIPVGLEMHTVLNELRNDAVGTLRAIAKMGYEVVQFYLPYISWSPDEAKEIRKVLDGEGIRCNSTHNSVAFFADGSIGRTIELNQILGSKYALITGAPTSLTLDAWKQFAGQMTKVSETLRPLGMTTGCHDRQSDWKSLEGSRPIDVLAANTPEDFILQLDVGSCIAAGADPVAWIKANPFRIRTIHCKDWGAGRDRNYRVLFGEGDAPWKAIFEAAESAGGVEYYLIEQTGSRFSPLETASRCFANWKQMRA